MKYIISKDEKRFIRREWIAYYLNKHISLHFIKWGVRLMENTCYGQEMRVYRHETK